MKHRLFFHLVAVITACLSAFSVYAQQAIPYLPALQSFGGASVTELTAFLPSSDDYTLEVNGTAETEINIGEGLLTYTPTATGIVRFAQKQGKVYVYEGNVYKTTLTPDLSVVTFPDIFAEANDQSGQTGIYNPLNLLQNPGFETFPNNIWKCYDNTAGNIDITAVGTSATSIRNAAGMQTEGTYALLFHKPAQYLTQVLSLGAIKPNSYYKLAFKYRTNSAGANQDGAVIRADLGTTERGTDIASTLTRTTQNNADAYDFIETFSVGSNVSEEASVWFLVERTSGANASQQKLEWYDNFTLVEGTKPTGISGVSSVTYLNGTAYAPEIALASGDYFDCTEFITNPSFDNNTKTGWTDSNSGTANYHEIEYWQKAFDFYQALSGLSSGKYTLKAQGFERPKGSDGGAAYGEGTEVISTNLYATSSVAEYTVPFNSIYSETYSGDGNIDGYVGNMAGAEIVMNEGKYEITLPNIIVSDNGNLTVGAKLAASQTGTWVLFDNFRLYYYGVDLTALVDAVNEKLAIAKADEAAEDHPGYINASELTAAIGQAETAVAAPTETALNSAYNALIQAITNYDVIIAAYIPLETAIAYAKTFPTDGTGYATFEPAITAAEAVYDNTEDQTANIADAIVALRTALKAYVLTQITMPADITPVIENPDFEEAYTEFAKPNTDRAIYQPNGWKAAYSDGDTNDMTYNAEVMNQDGIPWNGYSGQSYFTRQRWSTSSVIGLSQELTLPKGEYELKFYALAFGTTSDATGIAKGYVTIDETTTYTPVTVETTDPAAWAEYTVSFTVPEAGTVTIGVSSTRITSNNNHFKSGYDHFTLTRTSTNQTEITPIPENDPVVAVYYYNLQGVKVAQPVVDGFYLIKKVYASNKTSIEKLIYTK
jgi:hypothetical protein